MRVSFDRGEEEKMTKKEKKERTGKLKKEFEYNRIFELCARP